MFASPEQFLSFLSERDITLAQIARGRMREFYQCDLDIAGAYPGMAADAEVVSVRSAASLWDHSEATALQFSGRVRAFMQVLTTGGGMRAGILQQDGSAVPG